MGEDDNEDPEEDPRKEHEPKDDDEDPEKDPNEEPEHEEEDTKEEELSEGSYETKQFKEDETVITPPPPRHCRARIPAPLGHRTAMFYRRDDIPEEDMPPRRRFVFTTPPHRCDVAESFAAVAARAPRGQYDFVDTVEDVGYVRALYASEHRMMTSIEEVNLRISYQAQVRRQEMSEFKVEALQVKYPIIDWDIHSEGSRSYWKIIGVGGITDAYQSFEDMLKGFNKEDGCFVEISERKI
nr:hypothetical protein [Tanacetum cinerariifolium]